MMTTLLDVLILAMLAASLGYAALVDRRVRRLMAALEDLGPAVAAFSDATERAEGSVSRLRAATDGMAPARPRPDKAELIRRFFDDARGREA